MIVTTMSDRGYEDYGKKSLETWIEYTDYPIVVYYENEPYFEHERITYRQLFETKGAKPFLEQIADKPIFRGIKENTYNYMYDAFRFCRKVFAISDLAMTENIPPFFWLDADVIAHRKLPNDFLTKVLDNKYVSYLGRPWSYSECGFMAFDPSKPYHKIFMSTYRNFYLNGAFTKLEHWTDCHVFDAVRMALGVEENDLAIDLKTNHPFVNSVLGSYFDHLKGPERKKLGYSPELMERIA